MGIVAWVVFGFAVGLVARAVAPIRQGMGVVPTMVLGIAGAFAGGLGGSVLAGTPPTALDTSGLLGSVLGAVLLLLVAELVTEPRRRSA